MLEKRKTYTASTASFYAASVRDEPKCTFCGGLTLELGREKLRKEGKCFVCLGSRHVVCNCKVQGINCEECGQRHHKVACSLLASQQERKTHRRETGKHTGRHTTG